MYSVNFGAKFVTNSIIQKKDISGAFFPEKVSIVEIDCKKNIDKEFLKTLSIYRGQFSYAESLYQMALLRNDKKNNAISKIMVLTSQEDNFDDMNVADVKGFIEYDLSPNKEIRINSFEGFQDNFFRKKVRQYKHIGKSLLNYVLKNENPKKVSLHSTTYAKPFYISMGFRESLSSNSKYELEWLG